MEEQPCRKCGGTGYNGTEDNEHHDEIRTYKILCSFCYGQGQLDWIRNIGGKKAVTNPLYLIDEFLSKKLGDYTFTLEIGNKYLVKKEFGTPQTFEEKWKHVIINMKSLDPEKHVTMLVRAIDEPPPI